MSYITANQVVKEFGDGDARVAAVQGIDLSIEQAGFISIMGESGAGKSTLLSMLGGLLSPTRGEILMEGIDIYSLKRDKLADFRREFMGFIFQSFQLVPYLNVLETSSYRWQSLIIPSQTKKVWRCPPWSESVSRTRGIAFQINFPVGNRKGWPSHGPWSMNPRFCSRTSLRAIWIQETPRMS